MRVGYKVSVDDNFELKVCINLFDQILSFFSLTASLIS